MQALLLYLTDKLDARTLENANTSLSNVADAPMFGRWMVQFIEHARDLKK